MFYAVCLSKKQNASKFFFEFNSRYALKFIYFFFLDFVCVCVCVQALMETKKSSHLKIDRGFFFLYFCSIRQYCISVRSEKKKKIWNLKFFLQFIDARQCVWWDFNRNAARDNHAIRESSRRDTGVQLLPYWPPYVRSCILCIWKKAKK